MLSPKSIAIVVGVIVVIGGPIIFRRWWVSHPPNLPRNLRQNSVWIEGPPAPLFLAPRGVWLGCWLDTQRNVDRCQFADYKGVVWEQDDYTTCDNQSPLPDERLRLQTVNQATVRVFLQDGTMLIPVNLCNPRNRRADPLNTQPPLK
jgi:hypothetical protein